MMTHAVVAFGVTVCLVPLVSLILRHYQIVDRPGPRSSHYQPTLRGGGAAPALGVLTALFISNLSNGHLRVLSIITVTTLLVGVIEDARGIPSLARLLIQVLIATATLPLLLSDFTGAAWWLTVFALGAVIWLCAYINAFNFMDGINGISAAQAIVAGVAWFAIGTLAGAEEIAIIGLIVAAAALAFMPFNFPKARIFLGDAGSYFFGGYLGITLVLGLRAEIPFEAMVGPLAIYLADTAFTLMRRVRKGEVWHQPHRDHVYQRLVWGGWSHTKTTLVVGVFMAVSAVFGAFSLGPLPLRVTGAMGLIATLALYLWLPRAILNHEDTLPPVAA